MITPVASCVQEVHVGDSLVSIDDLSIPTLQEEVRRTLCILLSFSTFYDPPPKKMPCRSDSHFMHRGIEICKCWLPPLLLPLFQSRTSGSHSCSSAVAKALVGEPGSTVRLGHVDLVRTCCAPACILALAMLLSVAFLAHPPSPSISLPWRC